MTASQTSIPSTSGAVNNDVAPVVIAQATVTPIAPMGSSPVPPVAAPGPSSIGSLSNATPGTALIRDGVRIPVDGSHALLTGDRVLVPEGGQAEVLFPGSPSNKAPKNTAR